MPGPETRSWRRAASLPPEEPGLSLSSDHAYQAPGGVLMRLKGKNGKEETLTPDVAQKAGYAQVGGVWFSPEERRAGLLIKPPSPECVRDVTVAGRICKLEKPLWTKGDLVRAAAKPRLYTAEQYRAACQASTSRFTRRPS